jgi:hypothetical protein
MNKQPFTPNKTVLLILQNAVCHVMDVLSILLITLVLFAAACCLPQELNILNTFTIIAMMNSFPISQKA